MNRRDITIGLVILVVLIGVVYFSRRDQRLQLVPTPTPQPLIEEKIEDAFNVEIPEDVDKATLKDVSGGDASGIATRKFENGRFSHTVLADLPDPESGLFYEGWLVRGREGDADFAVLSTGKLKVAKGGWIVEFQSTTDYSLYNSVVVTLEKTFDKTPEKHILEGSF